MLETRNLTDRPKRLAPGVSALRNRPPLLGYLGSKSLTLTNNKIRFSNLKYIKV